MNAQLSEEDELFIIDIKVNLQQFIDEMNGLFSDVAKSNTNDLPKIERNLKSLEVRWDMYYQMQMGAVSDDSIPKMVAAYELLKQAINDTITLRKHRQDLTQKFNNAERYILSQDTTYQNLYDTVIKLSLVKMLGSELEIKKGNEQLLFAEIEKNYALANASAEEESSLKGRMSKLKEKYVTLKILSQKIQAAEYKSFFQRIKDYLLGIAAIAIILMFINMAQAKIKALKQARENAKKYKDLFNKKDDNIPCI